MRKFTFLGLFTLLFCQVNAQYDNAVGVYDYYDCSVDTADYLGFGYVAGNNAFGDFEKARMFSNQDNVQIEGVWAIFDGFNMVDDGGSIYFNIYSGNETVGPQNLLGQTELVAIEDINTDTLSYFPMDAGAVLTNENYYVSYVIPVNGADEMGLYLALGRDNDEDCGFSGTAHWEMWSDSVWYDMNDTWNDFHPDTTAIAIFPEVTIPSNTIENRAADVAVYPNPVQDRLQFSETLQSVQLLDLSGRLVLQASNATSLDLAPLSKGVYVLEALDQNDAPVRKKVFKE